MPHNDICTVKAIRLHGSNAVDYACAGDNIDLGLLGVDVTQVGYVLIILSLSQYLNGYFLFSILILILILPMLILELDTFSVIPNIQSN